MARRKVTGAAAGIKLTAFQKKHLTRGDVNFLKGFVNPKDAKRNAQLFAKDNAARAAEKERRKRTKVKKRT